MRGFLPEDRSLDDHVGKRKDAADDRTSIDTTWTSIDRDLIELGDGRPSNRGARCVFALAMLNAVDLLVGCCYCCYDQVFLCARNGLRPPSLLLLLLLLNYHSVMSLLNFYFGFILLGCHLSGCRRILHEQTHRWAYGIVRVLGKLHSLATLDALSLSLSPHLSLSLSRSLRNAWSLVNYGSFSWNSLLFLHFDLIVTSSTGSPLVCRVEIEEMAVQNGSPNAEAVDIFISVVRRSCHDPDFDLA